MNITNTLPAHKRRVLLGVDDKGNSIVVAKDEKACKELMDEITVNGGKCKVGDKSVQLGSAAIIGGGRYHKRRAFDPDYAAAKPAKMTDEQKAKQEAGEKKAAELAKAKAAEAKKVAARAEKQRKLNAAHKTLPKAIEKAEESRKAYIERISKKTAERRAIKAKKAAVEAAEKAGKSKAAEKKDK